MLFLTNTNGAFMKFRTPGFLFQVRNNFYITVIAYQYLVLVISKTMDYPKGNPLLLSQVWDVLPIRDDVNIASKKSKFTSLQFFLNMCLLRDCLVSFKLLQIIVADHSRTSMTCLNAKQW